MAVYNLDGIKYQLPDDRDPVPMLEELRNSPQHRAAIGHTMSPDEALDKAASMPVLERGAKGPIGLVETGANLASGFLVGGPMAAGRYASERLLGADHDQAMQGFGETQDKYTYEPRTTVGKALTKGAGEVLHGVLDTAESGLAKATKKGMSVVMNDPESAEVFDPEARLVANLATQWLLGGKQVAGIPKVLRKATEAREAKVIKDRADLMEAELKAKALEAENKGLENARKEPTQPDLLQEYGADRMQTEAGPPRPEMVDPGVQRDFWERPIEPKDLAEPRREGGEIPYEATRPDEFSLTKAEPDPMQPREFQDRMSAEQHRDPIGQGELPYRPRVEEERVADVQRRAEENVTEFKASEAAERIDVPEPKPGFLKDAVDKLEDQTIAEARETGVTKTFVPKGQRGSWTPFSSSEKPQAARSEKAQVRAELESRGIKLSDEVFNKMYDSQKEATAPKAPELPQAKLDGIINKVPNLREKLRDQYLFDPNPEALSKHLQELKASGAEVKDLKTPNLRKGLQDRFSAKDNPIVGWATSAKHYYKNLYTTLKPNVILHGETGTAANPTPGSFYGAWKQLDNSERIATNNVGQALNNVKTLASESDIQQASMSLNKRELTKPELQAYRDRVRSMKQVLKEFNEFLRANDKPPIPELPNYWSPMEYGGAHLILFKNKKSGEIVRLDGSYLKPNLKKLQRENPDLLVESMERGKKQSVDMHAFEIMIRQLDRDSRETVQEAVHEAIRKRGFRKHGEHRKGYEGAKGTKSTAQSMNEYVLVSEGYIRSAYEFMGNRFIDKAYESLATMKEAEMMPNARDFALDGLDQARGGVNKTMESIGDTIGWAVRKGIQGATLGTVTVPHVFAKDLIGMANRVRVTQLIGVWNPVQIFSQLLQPGYGGIKAIALLVEHGGMSTLEAHAAFARAAAKTMKELTEKDNVHRRTLDQMGANEATFRFDWKDNLSAKDYKMSSTDTVTGMAFLGAIEKSVVRTPTSLMFHNILKEMKYDQIAKDKNEVYRLTKELTDHYMVTNKWYEKPQAFGRSGLVGQMLSPLQSFSTTWIGMMKEFTQLAATGALEGSFAKTTPLLYFMAFNALTAGMLGLVGVREADNLITLANNMSGSTIPTMTEVILKEAPANRMLRFGVLSDMLGVNVGASLNAPSVGNLGAPGVELLANIANVAHKSVKSLSGKATDVEKREAWKGITPRTYFHGAIEEHFTPPGQPTQTNRGSGGFMRDAFDKGARYGSTYSTREAQHRVETYTMKQDAKRVSANFGHAISVIADRNLRMDTKEVKHTEEVITALLEKGYPPKVILSSIRDKMKEKMTPEQVRLLGRGTTQRQRRMYQFLNDVRE